MDYLNRVLIYLKQEISPNYRDGINLADDRILIYLNQQGEVFNEAYTDVYAQVSQSIARIRNRHQAIEVRVQAADGQQRDFKVH
jgi:hypothetical protein